MAPRRKTQAGPSGKRSGQPGVTAATPSVSILPDLEAVVQQAHDLCRVFQSLRVGETKQGEEVRRRRPRIGTDGRGTVGGGVAAQQA